MHRYAYYPKFNVELWEKKSARNVQRDKNVRKQLYEQGIKEVVIWEYTIKNEMNNTYRKYLCFLTAPGK